MIYFVRHGQTDLNLYAKGKLDSLGHFEWFHGMIDIDLNQTGIMQAQEMAKKLNGVVFDKCFCSPLKRTRQTCEIIFKGEIVFDDRLLERHHGEFEGKRNCDYDYDAFWNLNKQTFEKGESIADVEKRVFEFLDEIISLYPYKNILLVSHGGVARLVLSYFNGKPMDGDYTCFKIGNAELLTFN